MSSIVINALIDDEFKKRSKNIRVGEILEPPSPSYVYINSEKNINKKNIEVFAINSLSFKTWQNDILRLSFKNFHKNDDNINLHFLDHDSEDVSYQLLKKKNLYAGQLYLIKKLIDKQFNEDEYVFLIDSNFLFLSNLNKLNFNQNYCVSYPLDNIEYRNPMQNTDYNSWYDIIKIVHSINEKINLYLNITYQTHNVNKLYNNIKLYGLPIYIKKSLLILIIDRWIELTILLSNNNDDFIWLLALSLTLFEYNYYITNENIINICYTNSFVSFENKNFLFYNYKYKLISHSTKTEIFNIEKYKPWEIINYTLDKHDYKSIQIFIDSFNFFVTESLNCLKPDIKSV
jgi:hypothetical protein